MTVARVADEVPQYDRMEGLPFGTRGGLSVTRYFPQDGAYTIVALLLRQGANPSVRAPKPPPRAAGQTFSSYSAYSLADATPFLLAAMAADVPVMRQLLAAGADPTATTRDGTTALMLAAGLSHARIATRSSDEEALDAVTLLLSLGADVNAVNALGDTPLHGAAWRGTTSIVTLLLAKGANLKARNKLNWSPFTVADGVVVAGNLFTARAAADLLKAAGADPDPPNLDRQRY